MFISKILGCFTSKVSPIGTLYKEGKNGIKVYRYIEDSGKVKLSSFLPDGQPFKTITKQNIDGLYVGSRRVLGKSRGHSTDVQNHKTGIVTTIKKRETQYNQLTILRNENLGYTKEYSVRSTKDGNTVGKLIYIEETPKKGLSINADYDQSGNLISRESNEFFIIA